MAPSKSPNDIGDFVNIWTDIAKTSEDPTTEFYNQWVDHSTQKQAIPAVTGASALRKLYPKHSLVMTNGYGLTVLEFPAASVTPLETTQLITNLVFVPLARSMGIPGVLVDQVEYGAFSISWNQYEFVVYTVKYPVAYGSMTQYFILHEGPEDPARLFLLSAGAWVDALHDEIWVFNQGFWRKDHGLWREIQKADWKDVILKEEYKKALQKDVYGFFASEEIYKELAIPWKRGLIMYGPPGNGKTITLKTIMKTCGDKGFAPLYVKSFQSYKGEEGAMADVFEKARQYAPCVVILEDLDSLINDRNRSFFLNQMDGLEGNDGLLVIGTTNHLERLDPALSTRPSRFDKKFKFDDPDEGERKLYVQYWQNKLLPNKEIHFPDRLVSKVARVTDKFSFAYLKEAFVSSLVLFADIEGEKPSFESVLLKQIDSLREQLDKQLRGSKASFRTENNSLDNNSPSVPFPYPKEPVRPPRPDSSNEYDVHSLLDALSEPASRSDTNRRFYRAAADSNLFHAADERQDSRSFRDLLDNLSDSLNLDSTSRRTYQDGPNDSADMQQQRIREFMDSITMQAPLVERPQHPQSNIVIPPSGWPIRTTAANMNLNSQQARPAGYPGTSNGLIWK